MKIVEINQANRTYRGPYEWPDGSLLINGLMTLDDAVKAAYKPEQFVSPVPTSVAKWAMLCVIRARNKEDAVKTAIANYKGSNADRLKAKWEADPEVEREGPTANALGAAIGYTPEQVDDLFREAARVEAQ